MKLCHFVLIICSLVTCSIPLLLSQTHSLYPPPTRWSIDLPKAHQSLNGMQSTVDASANSAVVELALPNATQSTVVVLVLSARNHFHRRQAIRDTWAKGHDNVYFVVGAACPIPLQARLNTLKCQGRPAGANNIFGKRHIDYLQQEHEQLIAENENYRDIIVAPSPESYISLPNKLKYGYDFVIRYCLQAQWIVKTDDDFYARVEALPGFLQELNASVPTVVGKILWWGDPVRRQGKNAEHDYKKKRYPNFPLGSYGHVVSRPIAEYVAMNKYHLFEYQGEDTSLGIWLNESPLNPLWAKAGDYYETHRLRWQKELETRGFDFQWTEMPIRLSRDGNCTDKSLYVIGHDISPDRMRRCFDTE